MRILSSGLLLGAGVMAAALGVISPQIEAGFNQFVVIGLSLMSLGLFALRVNHPDTFKDRDDDRNSESYIPSQRSSGLN